MDGGKRFRGTPLTLHEHGCRGFLEERMVMFRKRSNPWWGVDESSEKVLELVLEAVCLQQGGEYRAVCRICPVRTPYDCSLVQTDDDSCRSVLLHI
jgi:hypothetical protein